MVLSFVLLGFAVSSKVQLARLAWTLTAYFLGLGLGAHSLDQLESTGSHYVEVLSRKELSVLAVAGLGAGSAIGVYYALTVTVWLAPLVLMGLFFALAYPLPSRVAGQVFHNDGAFAFSWGFLPLFTSSFVNAATVTESSLLVGVATGLDALAEIRLSRRARLARKAQGGSSETFETLEKRLKLLVSSTCLIGVLSILLRLWGL